MVLLRRVDRKGAEMLVDESEPFGSLTGPAVGTVAEQLDAILVSGSIVVLEAESESDAVVTVKHALAGPVGARGVVWATTTPRGRPRRQLSDLVRSLTKDTLPSGYRWWCRGPAVGVIGVLVAEVHRTSCVVILDRADVLCTRLGRRFVAGMAIAGGCVVVIAPPGSRRSEVWQRLAVPPASPPPGIGPGARAGPAAVERSDVPALGEPSSTFGRLFDRSPLAPGGDEGARPGRRGTGADGSAPILDVRVLGVFELDVDGMRFDLAHGSLAPSVLKYLLTSAKLRAHRDVLLETFWPDTDPRRSRNRLQAVVSSLRRSFRQRLDCEVIEFRDGAYRISDAVTVRLDRDEFASLVERGRSAEMDGDLEAAAALFREATDLYRGDLLAESPYDEWTVLARETARIEYLDLLDRRMALTERLDRTAERIEVSHLILSQDNCREDAYRTLMGCYATLGRCRESMRHFERCIATLEHELGARPSRETMRLYQQLRAVGS